MKPIIVGNWKMNGLRDDLPAIREVAKAQAELTDHVLAGLCVPATLLYVATTLADETALLLGAQDCHPEVSGPHTGDVSAEMIADCFAQLCIVGHSERRQDHGETSDLVRAKAEACLRAGLTPIVCVGETDEENGDGRTEAVLEAQLRGSVPVEFDTGQIIVAYEPVWAIGTGRVPAEADVARIHAFIRSTLAEHAASGAAVPLLYGGSVKPANAEALLAIDAVDGALVGGASLKPADFLGICEAAKVVSQKGTGS